MSDDSAFTVGFDLPGDNEEQAQGFVVPEFTAFDLESIEIAVERRRVNNNDTLRLAIHKNHVVTIPGGFVVGQPGDMVAEYFIEEPFAAERDTPMIHRVATDAHVLRPGETYWVVATTREPGVLRTTERLRWVANAVGDEGRRWRRIENGSWTEPAVHQSLSLRVTARPRVQGDFNGNELLDVGDISRLAAEIRAGSGETIFDVNKDGNLNYIDYEFWVRDLKNAYIGDANLGLDQA